MTPSLLFSLIILIIIVNFLISRSLSFLNSKNWLDNVPPELQSFYDEDKYDEAKEYDKINSKFAIIISSISTVFILVFLFFDGFAKLHYWLLNFTDHYILLPLLFFGILFIASDLISTPVALYKTFVIEERFGFNKMTMGTFIMDKIKGYILTAILGGAMISALVFIYTKTGTWFWLLAWILISAFSLFFATFYTSLIVPLFNKLKPLEDGSLRQSIEVYANKVNFPLKNIFIIDGSKRSSKANAFFSGLGKQKSIVLYDTLIEDNSEEELVAVLAHEVGHYKKKHIIQSLTISILQTGILLFILGWALNSPLLSQSLGVANAEFHIGLIAFSLLYSPVSTILGLLMNRFSRKNEFEADAYAKETYSGGHLSTALKRLSVNHLSNLNPHPLYVSFYYSHPPLLQRLKALNA